MTRSRIEAMLTESGLAPDEAPDFVAALAPLEALGQEPPAPSAALLALFAGETVPVAPVDLPQPWPSHRVRGSIAGAVVLALSGVGATGLSAAANTLPAPWQHHVSDFSHHYLPFEFPEPPARPRQLTLSDVPAPAKAGGVVEDPSETELELPATPQPSRSLPGPRPEVQAAPVGRPGTPGPTLLPAPADAPPSPGYATSSTSQPSTSPGAGAGASPATTRGPRPAAVTATPSKGDQHGTERPDRGGPLGHGKGDGKGDGKGSGTSTGKGPLQVGSPTAKPVPVEHPQPGDDGGSRGDDGPGGLLPDGGSHDGGTAPDEGGGPGGDGQGGGRGDLPTDPGDVLSRVVQSLHLSGEGDQPDS